MNVDSSIIENQDFSMDEKSFRHHPFDEIHEGVGRTIVPPNCIKDMTLLAMVSRDATNKIVRISEITIYWYTVENTGDWVDTSTDFCTVMIDQMFLVHKIEQSMVAQFVDNHPVLVVFLPSSVGELIFRDKVTGAKVATEFKSEFKPFPEIRNRYPQPARRWA